jgi:3-methyladenine DNA glycosylase AlkD
LKIKLLGDKKNVEGMARYGINPKNNYGVSIAELRGIAAEIGKNHALALELWGTGIRDARLLATLIGEPEKLTEAQAEKMVSELNSWDVCDGLCMWLLRYTPFAYEKAFEWSSRDPEFEKRAAFSLMATLAVIDKKSEDSRFEKFFPLILNCATDERNYVKKAVNWALRNIGKRNFAMNRKAIRIGKKLQKSASKSARWVGNDAVKELESETVQLRLARQKKRN